MINFNSIDISKWFKFPEVLITIGVILLIVSIILIIIAYLTTEEKTEQIDNDSVEEISNSKEENLSRTKDFKTTKGNKTQENSSKANVKKNNTNVAKTATISEDEDDIELL